MSKQGFTLIEILLVIAIISILASSATGFYRSFQINEELDITAKDVVQTLRDAQSRAIAGESDSSWGVHFDFTESEYGIFQGTEFSDYYEDEVEVNTNILTLENNLGNNDIYFSKISGEPSTTGSLIITSESNRSKTITVNSLGLISLE